jgi:hypothetical protein
MTARQASVLALALSLLLAACDGDENARGEAAQSVASEAAYAPAPPPPLAEPDMSDRVAVTGSRTSSAGTDASAPQASDGQPVQAEGMLLAYSYSVGFELPARNVAALKDSHEAECRAAGPQLCLVLGGSVSGDGQDYMYGNLNIRAEPQWLAQFRAGLGEDAEAANGRVASESTSTEDLTRSIVDTEARLAAQETLRERLLVLLERPTDEVDDLLAAERELARVQGDIDSARSQLAVMRARVNMSRLDLNYSSVTNPVSTGAFNPVVDALRNFLTVLAGSLATVITIIAGAIPFVLILIPLIIVTWRLFRRWRTRRGMPRTTTG